MSMAVVVFNKMCISWLLLIMFLSMHDIYVYVCKHTHTYITIYSQVQHWTLCISLTNCIYVFSVMLSVQNHHYPIHQQLPTCWPRTKRQRGFSKGNANYARTHAHTHKHIFRLTPFLVQIPCARILSFFILCWTHELAQLRDGGKASGENLMIGTARNLWSSRLFVGGRGEVHTHVLQDSTTAC